MVVLPLNESALQLPIIMPKWYGSFVVCKCQGERDLLSGKVIMTSRSAFTKKISPNITQVSQAQLRRFWITFKDFPPSSESVHEDLLINRNSRGWFGFLFNCLQRSTSLATRWICLEAARTLSAAALFGTCLIAPTSPTACRGEFRRKSTTSLGENESPTGKTAIICLTLWLSFKKCTDGVPLLLWGCLESMCFHLPMFHIPLIQMSTCTILITLTPSTLHFSHPTEMRMPQYRLLGYST